MEDDHISEERLKPLIEERVMKYKNENEMLK